MKKIHELLRLPVSKGTFGVEIECEGTNLQPIDSDMWKTEADGSLRGQFPHSSSEYVMKEPVSSLRLPMAMKQLVDYQAKAKLSFSFRTSVHVHVNVQALTDPELMAFLYACLLLEEPLMNFCGESRKGNRFCLRMKDAEGYDNTLAYLFREGVQAVRNLDGNAIRYAAINVHAIRKYGSVEFRGMRGNMDPEVIIPWCNTLLSIRNTAMKLGSPVEVYNQYIKQSNEEFAKSFMGKHFDLFNYPGLDRDMSGSFSLTIELPHIFKNRKEIPDEVVNYEWEEARIKVPRPRIIPAAPMPQALITMDEFIRIDAGVKKLAEAARITDAFWNDGAMFQGKLEYYLKAFKQVKEGGNW